MSRYGVGYRRKSVRSANTLARPIMHAYRSDARAVILVIELLLIYL